MTLKEAKKILKKEGFCLVGTSEPSAIDEAFTEFESPEICEAMQIINSAGYGIMMLNDAFNARKARLKEEYEKNTKASDSDEEQPKEGNPALKEAASQFNDALLDEQAKKIARLKKIIHKKNMKIEELRKERSIHLRGKVKFFGETVDLSQEICDKNEEIRLSKIREKNLTEVCQKYMKENEELKKKLADKIVNEIDARALKSAESALACKEQLIYYKDKIIANNKKKIAEKDEVIADLGKELAATKKELEGTNNLVRMVRNASKQYCEYGIAAEKMIQKLADIIVYDKPVSSEDFKEYRRWANGYRFNPQLPEISEEEEKKLTAKTLDFNAKCMKAARESINDVFESYAAKYAKSSLDDLKEKAYNSFNAKACKLGLVGSKDGNSLLNQMEGVDVAEEGADQSGKIVLCGKDFGKILKENEESAEELSKVLNDAIDQFLLFGEIIIKSEK